MVRKLLLVFIILLHTAHKWGRESSSESTDLLTTLVNNIFAIFVTNGKMSIL